MKLKKLSVLLSALLVASLTACAPKETAKKEEVSNKKLTIGVMGSIDTLPIVIANEKGYFKEEGLDVDVQIFTAAKDRDAALQAGKVDGVLCDEVAISLYQNSGVDMKITGTTTGAWKIVAGKDSGVKTMADLNGKKVGISEKTMIDYLVDDIAKANSVKVEKVAIPAMPARLEALRNNQIDAALLAMPFNDVAIADGGVEISTVSNDEAMIAVTAFLQDSIDKKRNEIKSYYKAYDKAVDYLNSTDIKEYEDILVKTVGYAEDMRGKIVIPQFKKNYLPAEEKVQKVMDWAKEKGLLEKDINAKDVISNVGAY
ncbi:ABC transporter substrate-binding protein [Clostridium carnis]